eukprot:CAMPEP_0177156716 /NCGR_PEP_ID=MMETSP0367-20130122/2872_1 /TAXON_ID=447022 ORGANISM="Scrippsiella hangoei-like, Strain SHHI-4" /NCGR_SAMPLE_ID=MMETSP0367 /ASSEMBLY_ACC=CAM_ASM_000362 /LENGTH=80 /DNA_ID=CAMNT_0018602183 /DNA_START=389 /DNA_END=631 /DNA_ORIENTATION=-
MAAKQPGPEGLLDVEAATAAGLRATSPPAKDPITDVGAYLSMTPSGWIMLNSSVASFPAKESIASIPPGWSSKNDVTSRT